MRNKFTILSVKQNLSDEQTRSSISNESSLKIGSDDLDESRADGLPQLRLTNERILLTRESSSGVVVGEEGDGGGDEVTFGSRGEEVERHSSTELGLEEFEELELSDDGLSNELGITGEERR